MVVTRVWCAAAVRLAAVSCALAASTVAQQVAWPGPGSHVYRGAIATSKGQLDVQMTLSLPGQGEHREGKPVVVGEYRYATRGQRLELVGEAIGDKGELVLRESVAVARGERGAETGRFDGKLDAGARHFAGTWRSPDGRTALRFALELVAVERTVTTRQPLGPDRTLRQLVMTGRGPLVDAVNGRMHQELLDYVATPASVDDEPTWREFRDAQDGVVSGSPASLHTDEGGVTWAAWHIGDELVSLGASVWDFSGGAHGNHALGCLNLVLRSGQAVPLHLCDLAVDERAGPRLCELVRDRLRELGASGADGVEDQVLDQQSFEPFLISPAGIVIGFSPYEVGSYAEGCYYVALSWADLRGVLVPPPQLGLAVDAAAKRAVDAAARSGR